jgi:hypothetical protein
MIETAAAEQLQSKSGSERRVWIRYGSDLEAVCCAPQSRKEVGWPGRIKDISRGGLALLLRHRFRAGTPLFIEVRDRQGDVRYIAARVVHANSVIEDGEPCWLLGCQFPIQLNDNEIDALV